MRKTRDLTRYAKAADLRTQGETLKQIGSALGVSGERARQMVKFWERRERRLKNTQTPPIDKPTEPAP